ncbi:MAG TPA: PLP-dependent aminotransferase family protein [Azonexus sp.]
MRRAPEIDFALPPRTPGTTLQQWLYDEIRAAVLGGRLRAGQRLPASRDLARQQGVSRGTVVAVYEQLTAEGYLAGTPGRGTAVSDSLPAVLRPAGRPAAPNGEVPGRLATAGQRLAATPFPLAEPLAGLRCFRPNQPDLAAFPHAVWNRIAARRANGLRPAAMTYGEAGGEWPLRRALAEHLRVAQRISCRPEQVMIVGSAQQGLDLLARLLLDPGDAAWVEDPGYPGAARVFAAAGAHVAAVPVDAAGLDVAAGVAQAPAARLAYVTAAHQSPLGMALAIERRLALLDWAREAGATIVEDDYDGEFRFAGAPLAALKSLDASGRVVYLGTFSKLLFPALRLAYVVLPEWLVEPFAAGLSLTCRHLSRPLQQVLHDFIADGHFARHLRHMRVLYGERAAALQEACREQLAGALNLLPITTGLDATALLPAGSDDWAVAARLAEAGIETRPLAFYGIARRPPPGLVLGYSAFTPEQIRAGVARMAAALA